MHMALPVPQLAHRLVVPAMSDPPALQTPLQQAGGITVPLPVAQVNPRTRQVPAGWQTPLSVSQNPEQHSPAPEQALPFALQPPETQRPPWHVPEQQFPLPLQAAPSAEHPPELPETQILP